MAVAPVRVRKDVYKLAAGDKTLEWYGKAIAEMKKRPIKDPTSWRYQGAIHGYSRSEDPFAKASDVLPSSADRTKFWNVCQHGSWYFLSWHRGYLIYFERICLKAIIAPGRPVGLGAALLELQRHHEPERQADPAAFRPSTVGGQRRPPVRAGHNGGASGNPPIDPVETSLNCLTRTKFVGAGSGGSPASAGPDGFHHGGGVPGACEQTPHNDIHGAVGGWMGSFNTAGARSALLAAPLQYRPPLGGLARALDEHWRSHRQRLARPAILDPRSDRRGRHLQVVGHVQHHRQRL